MLKPAMAAAAVGAALFATPAGAVPVPNPWPALGVTCHTRGMAAAAFAAGVNCRHVLHENYPRRFVVWVPPSALAKMRTGRRVPLVLMLHGSSGSGEQFLKISGWKEKATREGFVAAFPTGLVYEVSSGRRSTKWSSFNLPGEININTTPRGWSAATFPADDVGFLRRLIRTVRSDLRIDARRIHVAGFSNGGEMCSRAGIEMSDVLASVACNAGFLDVVHRPPPGLPDLPKLSAIGSRDDRLLAYLAPLPELPLVPSALWALLGPAILSDELASLALADQPRRDARRQRISQLRWTAPLPGNVTVPGTNGNELRFLVLDEVMHTYPRGPVQAFPRPQGSTNPLGIVMVDLAWPFFAAHPR